MKNTKILLDDLNSVVNDINIPWQDMKDSSVLVTGATGMIGRGCVRVLAQLNHIKNLNIKIYATGRNIEKGQELELLPGVKFIQANITEHLQLNSSMDFVIHCAAVTKSSEMVANPVGLIETELVGSKNILELARQDNVKSIVYTSSMESYGQLNLSDVKETDQGYVDLKNPRSSYPMCKRMIELLCNSYYSQYHLPTKIVRLGMTFGAGENFAEDNRAWAQFLRCALAKKDIVLHTKGESVSSFCYLSDALRGIFLTLLTAPSGETYNIATLHCQIKEFAERIAGMFGVSVEINQPANIKQLGYAGEFKLPLNTDKIKQLGWCPQVTTVENMVTHVIDNM